MTALDPVLVSGAAGFIGMHVAQRLLRDGHTVVGLDNLNDYYDPKLKDARLATLTRFPNFAFKKLGRRRGRRAFAQRSGIKCLSDRGRRM